MSFWGLSKLVGVAHERPHAQATELTTIVSKQFQNHIQPLKGKRSRN